MIHDHSISGRKKVLYTVIILSVIFILVALSFLIYTYKNKVSPDVYPTTIESLVGTYVSSDFSIEIIISIDSVRVYELEEVEYDIKGYYENVLVITDDNGIEHYILAISSIEIYSQSHKNYFLRVS